RNPPRRDGRAHAGDRPPVGDPPAAGGSHWGGRGGAPPGAAAPGRPGGRRRGAVPPQVSGVPPTGPGGPFVRRRRPLAIAVRRFIRRPGPLPTPGRPVLRERGRPLRWRLGWMAGHGFSARLRSSNGPAGSLIPGAVTKSISSS